MAGADQRKPELRAASIKGTMRFIWRAVQRAEDMIKLRECEGKLFGNAFGGKDTKASDMRIRIEADENIEYFKCDNAMLPHRKLPEYEGRDKDKGRVLPQKSIDTGYRFSVVISSFGDENRHTDYVRLFVLTCLLYGFGRRSRKGFGTVMVTEIKGIGENIIDFLIDGMPDNLNALSKFGAVYSFANDDRTEITVTGGGGEKYPYIENIRIAGTKDDSKTDFFIEQIGMSVHNFSNSKTFLGDSRNRFASSILLSTTPWNSDSFCCIVTQLYCTKIFDEKERDRFHGEIDRRV